MADFFENPQTEKLEDETETQESANKKVDQIADKLAGKSSKTVKEFDKDNENLFSK